MSNIRELRDLASEDEENGSGEEGNEYYAGGHKSGQVIKGAPDQGGRKDAVNSLFEKARRAGAVEGTPADLTPASGFAGHGRTLGASSSQATPDVPRSHTITFYQNNIFVVDDGEARRVDDPANRDFIESISKGECPAELDAGQHHVPINVNLIRKGEDYVPPEKPKYTAFQGTGRTLGHTTATEGTPQVAASASEAGPSGWEGIDESRPSTTLQIRLSDGSRMVARFNHHHTVADIRRFIHASRPDLRGDYQLATAFPSTALTDDSQTVEGAGLLNAVVFQKQ